MIGFHNIVAIYHEEHHVTLVEILLQGQIPEVVHDVVQLVFTLELHLILNIVVGRFQLHWYSILYRPNSYNPYNVSSLRLDLVTADLETPIPPTDQLRS